MSEREWHFYLKDMIRFAENVMTYTSGMDQGTFVSSALSYDATLRNLELVGEAATHIPDDVRKESPFISWRMIIATRNRLIHGYPGIDDDTLWSIITDEVPELLSGLEKLVETTRKTN